MANGSDTTDISSVKKIGIIYSDVLREYFPTEQQYITEKDAKQDAELIAEEIKKLGIDVLLYPGNDKLISNIENDKPNLVFNLVDSVKGNEYLSSTIPGILDMLDTPYTGAGLLGMALCFNKFLTKKVLQNSCIPVPNFQLFNTSQDPLEIQMRFPLISKLNEIHGAVEINETAISENEKELRDRLNFLITTYKQSVLVEEYIGGREITCMILHGINTKVYMAEKVFNKYNQKYQIATFDDQWGEGTNQDRNQWKYNYSKYEDPNLRDMVRKAFDVTRMSDYGKFDVRFDNSGRYYFIDSNVNPAFGPKELLTAMGLIIEELYGVPFPEIVRRLIFNTITY